MSVLAQFIADLDVDAIVPGTDIAEYESLLVALDKDDRGFSCLDICFGKILPVPREDVSFVDILRFKHDRRKELLRFRAFLSEIQRELSVATDIGEVKEKAVSFKEQIEFEFNDLQALLNDSRISTVFGTLKTLINVKSPTFIGMLAVGGGYVSELTEVPIEWTSAGLAVCGALQIACHLVSRRNEKRAALRSSPFAYIYHAQSKGLLQDS